MKAFLATVLSVIAVGRSVDRLRSASPRAHRHRSAGACTTRKPGHVSDGTTDVRERAHCAA